MNEEVSHSITLSQYEESGRHARLVGMVRPVGADEFSAAPTCGRSVAADKAEAGGVLQGLEQ
eukprot:5737516-Prymnesium_polylepis.1